MKKNYKKTAIILLTAAVIIICSGSIMAFSQYEKDVSDRLYNDLDKKYRIEKFSADSSEQKILNRLVSNLSNKEMKEAGFEIHYIDSDVINAYYIGNGKIMLFRGLLDELKTSEQLAGLIAHEMGHAYHRHLYKDLENNMGIAVIGLIFNYFTDNQYANITGIAQNLITKGFSREQEQEADLFAVDLMFKSDYNPQGLVGLMKIFKEKSGGSKLLEFTQTHPIPDTRIEYISDYIDKKTGKKIGDVSIEDTDNNDDIPEINRNKSDQKPDESSENNVSSTDRIELKQKFSDKHFSIQLPESWKLNEIRKQRSDELSAYELDSEEKNILGVIRIFDLGSREFMETAEKNYKYQLISDEDYDVIDSGKLNYKKESYYIYKESENEYKYEYLISLTGKKMLKALFSIDKKINEKSKVEIEKIVKSISN
ncbi:MAG: M48 family metallopeptidase [Bacillota bacterium]